MDGRTPAPEGICRLCKQHRILRESHLLPAYLYKQRRLPDRKNPNPVIVTPESARTSSNQVKDYVLCHGCEGLFNKNGETWMSQYGFLAPGKFKLQEAMRRTAPLARIQNANLISGARALSPEALAKLVYFSASVFWRAAVHSWRLDNHPLAKIDLGKFEDDFRLYLLGEAQFPNHAAIWCHVSPAEIPMGGMVFPHLKGKGTCHPFRFAIPGVEFDLFVGQTIPQEVRQTCLRNSADHVIFLSDVADANLVSWLRPWSARRPVLLTP